MNGRWEDVTKDKKRKERKKGKEKVGSRLVKK